MVRLLTYLPGTPVAKIAAPTQLLYDIGKLAASLDKALTEVSFCCSGSADFIHVSFLLPVSYCFLSAFLILKQKEVGDFRA